MDYTLNATVDLQGVSFEQFEALSSVFSGLTVRAIEREIQAVENWGFFSALFEESEQTSCKASSRQLLSLCTLWGEPLNITINGEAIA